MRKTRIEYTSYVQTGFGGGFFVSDCAWRPLQSGQFSDAQSLIEN